MKSSMEQMVEWLEEDNSCCAYHPGSWAYRALEKARSLLAAAQSQTPTEDGLRRELKLWLKLCWKYNGTIHVQKEAGYNIAQSHVSEILDRHTPPHSPKTPIVEADVLDSIGCCPKCGLLIRDMSHNADGEKGLFEAISELANCRGRRVSTKELRDTLNKFRGGK